MWPVTKLKQLCEIFTDGDWIETKDQSASGIRLIQTGNIGCGIFKNREAKGRYISTATFKRLRCTEIFPGDCLISRLPDPVGRSCILPDNGETMITAVDCTIVRFKTEVILPDFFNFYSQSLDYLGAVDTETTGTTRKRISRSKLGQVPIPVPPLPEQRRIVGILDEAFEGIAKAKANTEKNLANARALFESHLHSVFTQRGEGWVEKPLTDVVDNNCSLSYGIVQPGKDCPDGLPVVRPMDLTSRVVASDSLKRIDPSLADSYQRTTLFGGDLLLCVRGTTGTVSFAAEELAGANVTRGIVPIRFDQANISQGFGYYALISRSVQAQIQEKTYGAALMQINIRDLRCLAIPYPLIHLQKKLVKTFEIVDQATRELESIYQQKLDALEELKKSLLHQAFTGKLPSTPLRADGVKAA